MLQRFVALNITLSFSAFKLLNGSQIFTYTLQIYDLTHRDAFTWYNNLYLRYLSLRKYAIQPFIISNKQNQCI